MFWNEKEMLFSYLGGSFKVCTAFSNGEMSGQPASPRPDSLRIGELDIEKATPDRMRIGPPLRGL